MKKLILGFVLGTALSLSSVSVAADFIQAVLFPVQFEINGKQRDLGAEYKVLNYEGHAYVPVRFITESLGATALYEAGERKITIQGGPLNITDGATSGISVGNLQFTKEGGATKIIGQLVYKKGGDPFFDTSQA